jgi:hypothetical protein
MRKAALQSNPFYCNVSFWLFLIPATMQKTHPTFSDTDKFELDGFCRNFERFLLTEHHFADDGLVVSLNAPFGCGKTTFLRMWAADLLSRREENSGLPVPVILNAWENDYCGDPLLAIASAFSKVIDEVDVVQVEKKKQKFRNAAKILAWFTISVANGVFSNVVGADPLEAAEHAKAKVAKKQPAPDLLNLYEERFAALNDLRFSLTEIFGGSQPKAIVMIDELDRCRPDYAIHYLETIKHVFDVEGVVFVIAIDKDQLKSSAKAMFGADLNFKEYFRKFVRREFFLPKPSPKGVRALCEVYGKKFFESVETSPYRRFSALAKDKSHFFDAAASLITAFSLTPRMTEEVFRMVGHAASCSEELTGRIVTGYAFTALFMAVLSISHPEQYRAIGTRALSPDQLVNFVAGAFPKSSRRDWWVVLLLYGYFRHEYEDKDALPAVIASLVNAGVLKAGATVQEMQSKIESFSQVWDHMDTGNGIAYVFRAFESIAYLVNARG